MNRYIIGLIIGGFVLMCCEKIWVSIATKKAYEQGKEDKGAFDEDFVNKEVIRKCQYERGLRRIAECLYDNGVDFKKTVAKPLGKEVEYGKLVESYGEIYAACILCKEIGEKRDEKTR